MIWLMFPAYNEKENLINLIPEMSDYLKGRIPEHKILLINDGSTDSTGDMAKTLGNNFPIEVISHDVNKGVGAVFKTGFSAINNIADNKDFLIILEADGTSDYTLIPEIVEKLEKGNDIVIASRYVNGGAYKNFPFKRFIISYIGNFILKSFFKKNKVTDYTIFYRGYRVSLIKKALQSFGDRLISSDTFLANTEMLINFTKLTDRLSEVPFIYAYDKKKGKSKMPLYKTLVDYIRFLAKYKKSYE